MKAVESYLRRGRLYLVALSRTTEGLWIHQGECIVLDRSGPLDDFGNAIRVLLARSLVGIPHPKAWGDLMRPVLEAAGVRSYSAFVRGATLVHVNVDREMEITPTENLGTDGFAPMSSKITRLANSCTDGELAASVLHAHEEST